MKRLLALLCLIAMSVATTATAQSKRAKSTAPPIKVACVGNSITFGYGIDQRETYSYPAQLQQMLGPGYLVGNFGKSGATLLRRGHRPYNEQEEYHKALAFGADLVVIHLGINDTDPRNWPNYRDSFVSDYLQLIDSLKEANRKARFIIARLSPIHVHHSRFESGSRDWHAQIQQRIETVAQISGAQLIDFYAPLLPYPNLLPDALHPTREGATRLARTVYSAITGDFGGLQMPATYTDGMVLQRRMPLDIRGTANAGEQVKLHFAKRKYTTTADSNGQWHICIEPQPANAQGQELRISTSTRSLVYRDVLVGEVWLASGQSNMAYMMQETEGYSTENTPHDPHLRLLDLKGRWETRPGAWAETALDSVNDLLYYQPAQWQEASPEQAGRFSAVGYTFGRHLRDSLNVPIGIICNAVGGSPTEAWIDRTTLEYEFPAILRHWRTNDFIQDWVRKRASDNISLRSDSKTQRHPYEPTYLFDAGIRPLGRYPIRGVIWYQGESNAHNVEAHERLFTLLLQSWRGHWGQSDLPFYFVQLSSLDRPSWPHFRDSQRRLADRLPHVAMVVSSDHGHPTDVHPKHKAPIGYRLALQALRRIYGHQGFVIEGPRVASYKPQGKQMILELECAEGLCASDGGEVRGFEIAEHLGLYVQAKAVVQGRRIILSAPGIDRPRYVRYGWQPFTNANLINGAGLPASTYTNEP